MRNIIISEDRMSKHTRPITRSIVPKLYNNTIYGIIEINHETSSFFINVLDHYCSNVRFLLFLDVGLSSV